MRRLAMLQPITTAHRFRGEGGEAPHRVVAGIGLGQSPLQGRGAVGTTAIRVTATAAIIMANV